MDLRKRGEYTQDLFTPSQPARAHERYGQDQQTVGT